MAVAADVLKIYEGFAPVAISDAYCKKYGAYDNSGMILNFNDELTGVLFSLDLSPRAIEYAKKLGYNCIVTHHPAIFSPVSHIDATNPADQSLYLAVKNNISVISMHLNSDLANGGIDEALMHALGGVQADALYEEVTLGDRTCSYGRVYPIPACDWQSFCRNAKISLQSDRAVFYGKNSTVGRVASFCGAGADEKTVAFAKANGADVIVSSDFKHHVIAFALSLGLNVANITHYSAENYGFYRIYTQLTKNLQALGLSSAYFCDEDLL